MKGNFAAITLLIIGALALAVNLDLVEIDLVQLLRKWWPLGLMAIGVALFFTPSESTQKRPD
jgi:hypothetical protein